MNQYILIMNKGDVEEVFFGAMVQDSNSLQRDSEFDPCFDSYVPIYLSLFPIIVLGS